MTVAVPITAPSLLTPVTGAASYCTPLQLFICSDVRTVAQLLSDTDTPIGFIPATNSIDKTVVANDPTLALLLQAASGKLEGAVTKGNMYSPGDLILLTTGSFATANSAMWIAQIVAGITIASLYRRRPDVMMPKIPMVEESEAILDALADGSKILPLQETMDAGRMNNQIEQLADVQQRFMPSYENRRVLGRRNKWRDT